MRSALNVDSSSSLVRLIYELLDAHDDTAQLAVETPGDDRWAAHVDYLRHLQRVGRETLARHAASAAA
jgi:hypothetical protein